MDIRGLYEFSSLMKQKIKGKICFVIHIAGERKTIFLYLRCDCEAFQNHMHTCQRRDALTEPTWQGHSTDCERGLIELRLGRLHGEIVMY